MRKAITDKKLKSKASDMEEKNATISEDQEQIMEESAHLADRDQLFGNDSHSLPFPAGRSPANEWSGDDEDAIKGERDLNIDLVDAWDRVPMLSEPINKLGDMATKPWPAPPASLGPRLDMCTDEELHQQAQALGINGYGLPRHRLMNAIAEALSGPLD